MKNSPLFARPTARAWAFTLIELLAVITIIGILAGMVLGAVVHASGKAKVAVAKQQMKNLLAAINQYEATYGRLPAPSLSGPYVENGVHDVTFGLGAAPLPSNLIPLGSDPWRTNTYGSNDVIMTILMDLNYGANTNHQRNPQQRAFFEEKMVSDAQSPGISTIDYQYRDPWGSPYIITLDLNGDGKCDDAFYRQKRVSQNGNGGQTGLNGLFNSTDAGGDGDNFEYNGSAMIWSLGPDKLLANQNTPLPDSDAPWTIKLFNKDNVVGWQ